MNQDYVEVWGSSRRDSSSDDAWRSPGPGQQPLVIGAVLDGHGLLGETAARASGAAVVRELRQLLGLWDGLAGGSGGGADAGTAAAASDAAAASAGNKGTADGASRAGCGSEADCAAAAPGGTPSVSLEAMPAADVQGLVERAFQSAHDSALAIYDDPPRTCCYPDARTGADAVYCLHSRDGLQVYAPPAGSRSGATSRLLECGATCTVAVMQGRRLVVGNVGDSSAVLGSLDEDGGVSARLLTFQHCGLHPAEAARIAEGYSGRVRILPNDGYMSVSGPSIWAGYELGVTRALGHKHMEYFGVLHKPSVACLDLRPEDCCVVIASDGVWDVMEPREVVNRVMETLSDGRSAAAAARQLVEDAVELAKGGPAGEADNTSACVIALPM